MYKKILCILLIFYLMLFTGACSKSKDGPADSNTPKLIILISLLRSLYHILPGVVPIRQPVLFQSVISEYLPNKQSIVVINEPSGSGTIGCTKVANSKPDGYTLLLSAGELSLPSRIMKELNTALMI
jgi:hypothetical protein